MKQTIQHTIHFNPETYKSLKKLSGLRDRSINYIVNDLVHKAIELAKTEWIETKGLKSIPKGMPSVRAQWNDSGAADEFGE